MADGAGILVIGEFADGELASSTFEALAAGRALLGSLPGEQLSIVIAAPHVSDAPEVTIAHGE